MDSQTKTCQNCKASFEIDAQDFLFYEKVKVPAPTFCPECRMIRRMMTRNERALYRRPCQGVGHSEEVISMYSSEKPHTVYDQKLWWSDEWDSVQFGKEYDFSKPFFEQFKELWQSVPLLALSNSSAVNSDYCNVADQSKDSYMVSGSFKVEAVLYSNRVYTVKDSLDLYVGFRDELCYECVHCSDCYRVFFSQQCSNCANSSFLYDCRNCLDCFGCTNLRNKQYCIFNQQYTREKYAKKILEFDLSSARQIEIFRQEFERIYLASIHRYATILKSENVVGDNIDNAKNCLMCFDITEGAEDCKFLHWGGLQTKDVYDGGPGIGDAAELMYEAVDTGLHSSDAAFTNVVYGSYRIRYALFCHNSSNIFGGIGLRNKQYCILNKHYSRNEYELLLPKVIKHMIDVPYVDARGREYRYGEFFPAEIVPFAYNETIAQDYFPLTREEALRRGYAWKDFEGRHYAITLKVDEIPERSEDIRDDMVKEVMQCEHAGRCNEGCTTAFKITSTELSFYRRLSLPLPRRCFNCRHARRLQKRNPLKLWHRACQCAGVVSGNGIYQNTASHFHASASCPNKFETSYAPDRPEIVYCESCYQSEII